MFSASDPCRNSPQLPLLPQRVVGYVLKPKEKEICDQYLMEGWYKIDKGYTLATTKNGCGTMYPWHLNGNREKIANTLISFS